MEAKKVGSFIAEVRKEKGMTQKELADVLHVTDKAVSRWETGKGIPDVTSLSEISEYFGISINEILCGKRMEDTELRSSADKTVLHMIKKERKMKWKLAASCLAVFILLVLLYLSMPAMVFGSTFPVDEIDNAFSYAEELERKGISYTVEFDTDRKGIHIKTEALPYIQ
ncbi:MAG: helix-turn-helix domain-containing protein [Lachnospiraceae bacterium]|nr:helix-turn-helix domain-containing protein [Lachnospiraceae bacterium]